MVPRPAAHRHVMLSLQDSHNLLRPETVESLFVVGQVTGNVKYQEWGWHIFRAWEKFSRVSTGGYTNLESVLQVWRPAAPMPLLPDAGCAGMHVLGVSLAGTF